MNPEEDGSLLFRAAVVMTLVAAVLGASISPAAPSRSQGAGAAERVRSVGPDLNDGRPLPLDLGRRRASDRRASTSAPEVGDRKDWLSLDEVSGQLYLKRYKLRAEGDHVEVWVAKDRDFVSHGLAFPDGDCRNDERVTISDRQVRYIVREFDRNIFPKESAAFSRPPPRNGSDAALPFLFHQPRDYYRGPGRRIVVLIDNVRDDNFYDLDNSNNTSYIAGFFSSQYSSLLDRNVLTVDGFDWSHRLRADPPHEPVPGDTCASKPARPYLYESVLAHEYQHLLESYRDSAETTWVNEGLSDWAQTVTGYVDARVPITEVDFDSHVQAFLGWIGVQTAANPNPTEGGPENSLTWWKDQGDAEILADYGSAYTLMLYLADRYGDGFVRRMHRNAGVGLRGVQALLDDVAPGSTAEDVVHRWAAMAALDAVLDDGAVLSGGAADDYSARRLHAAINWDAPDAYSTGGAPPNGSDYVRLRDGTGEYLGAAEVHEIDFDGEETLTPDPVEWTVDESPPDRPDDPALYSGVAEGVDRAIVRPIAVPTDDPVLSLETRYEIDDGFDGAFVQVSTDGGASYTSLANDHTTNDFPSGGSDAGLQAPGLTGSSNGWVPMTFDLSQYAGRDVLLSFRYITDAVTTESGWWVDDVAVGGEAVSFGDDVEEWATPSELHPQPVSAFTVQLVAYDDAHTRAWLYELPLDSDFDATLTGGQLAAAIGDTAQTVAAIVSYDEPTERIEQYARYSLTVDGIEQPGG